MLRTVQIRLCAAYGELNHSRSWSRGFEASKWRRSTCSSMNGNSMSRGFWYEVSLSWATGEPSSSRGDHPNFRR